MKIVWDEPKRRINFATHGLDLADAEWFDWEAALVVPAIRGRTVVRGFAQSATSMATS
jgi:uncharacterized DUF497 family protein